MTAEHDCRVDMGPSSEIDEATADLVLSTTPPPNDEGLAEIVGFLADMRAAAVAPPAPVSAPLAAVLRDGLAVPPGPVAVARRRPARWRRVLASGAVGMGLAGSGIAVAATTNLLPEDLTRSVGAVVESLTPFEVRAADRPPSASVPNPAGPGLPVVGPTTSSPAPADHARPSAGSTVVSVPGAPPSTAPATTVGRVPLAPPAAPATVSPAATPSTTLPTTTVPSVPSLPPTTVPGSSPRPTLPPLPLP